MTSLAFNRMVGTVDDLVVKPVRELTIRTLLLPLNITLFIMSTINSILSEILALSGTPPPGFTSSTKVSEMSTVVEHLQSRDAASRAQLKDLSTELESCQSRHRTLLANYSQAQAEREVLQRDMEAIRAQLVQAAFRYKRAVSGQGLTAGVHFSLMSLAAALWWFHRRQDHDMYEYRIVNSSALVVGVLCVLTLLRWRGTYCEALIFALAGFTVGFVLCGKHLKGD